MSDYILSAILVGAGATVLTDVWGLVRHRLLGVPALDYGLLGRWIGHLVRGRWRRQPIPTLAPLEHERLIGWTAHYLIGIAFAALLLAVWGLDWTHRPTLTPALIIGVGGVVAPFFILQPAMGSGIAASRTPRPWAARLHTLITHTIFGLGLYASAGLTTWLDP